jgi:DNA-binding NarL/FixJ family response regulator
MTRILLADDHPIVLDGLAMLLTNAGFEVAARCQTGDAARPFIERGEVDVAVLDIQMPGATGLELLRDVRDARRKTPRIVILTASLEIGQLVEAVELEADGLVLKETAAERIVHCVEEVAAGRQWIDNDALLRVVTELGRREARAATTQSLTEREAEVARLAAKGMRNRDIALTLGVSESTVKMHLGNVFGKLGIDSRAALAALAREHGLAG